MKEKLAHLGTEFYLKNTYSFFSEKPIRKFINFQVEITNAKNRKKNTK